MQLGYTLSGAAPRLKRYRVASTMIAGIPVLNQVDATAGIATSTTTSTANAIGVSLDGATYTTSPTLAANEGIITVAINPDAVWSVPAVGSATLAALLTTTNSATSTTVITITTTGFTDPAPNSPDMDEGSAFCIYGANAGQQRIINSTASTTATVTVPFLNTSAVNDVFVLFPVPMHPSVTSGKTITLSTNLTAARMDSGVSGGAAMRIVEIQFDFYGTRTSTTRYVSNTYLEMMLDDHCFRDST